MDKGCGLFHWAKDNTEPIAIPKPQPTASPAAWGSGGFKDHSQPKFLVQNTQSLAGGVDMLKRMESLSSKVDMLNSNINISLEKWNTLIARMNEFLEMAGGHPPSPCDND